MLILRQGLILSFEGPIVNDFSLIIGRWSALIPIFGRERRACRTFPVCYLSPDRADGWKSMTARTHRPSTSRIDAHLYESPISAD
jgi:hypothetical protein